MLLTNVALHKLTFVGIEHICLNLKYDTFGLKINESRQEVGNLLPGA